MVLRIPFSFSLQIPGTVLSNVASTVFIPGRNVKIDSIDARYLSAASVETEVVLLEDGDEIANSECIIEGAEVFGQAAYDPPLDIAAGTVISAALNTAGVGNGSAGEFLTVTISGDYVFASAEEIPDLAESSRCTLFGYIVDHTGTGDEGAKVLAVEYPFCPTKSAARLSTTYADKDGLWTINLPREKAFAITIRRDGISDVVIEIPDEASLDANPLLYI